MNFVALHQTHRQWRGMAAAPNGDIYACDYSGDIYKQLSGDGDFVALSQQSRQWSGMAAAPNGDIYACEDNGDIYKQLSGDGDFVALSQQSRQWRGMAAAPNGDIYACEDNGDIYEQLSGDGDFIALSQQSRQWRGMAAAPNGDIYACVAGGDIYKQLSGDGDFVALSQQSRQWWGVAAAPNGDIYACVAGNDIYKQLGGSGNFISLSAAPHIIWRGIVVSSDGCPYACAFDDDIFKQFATVSYDGNGNTGGITPIDSSQYAPESIVVVLGNTGNLTLDGYVFDNWNTVPDGSGTAYISNDTFSINDNITLFALWIPIPPPSPPTPPPIPIEIDGFDIPLFENGIFSETVSLDGNNYGISLSWNARAGAWFMSIADGNGNMLRTGLRLNIAYPLKKQFNDVGLPAGDFLLIDKAEATWKQEAGRNDFVSGRKLELWYLPKTV